MQIKIWWPFIFVAGIVAACALIFPSDLRLADLLGRSGYVEQAIATDLRVLQHQPERHDVRVHLAKLYLTKGDQAKALAEIERVGINRVDETALLNQIADIYSQFGRRQKTVATLERIHALVPNNLAYCEKLGEAYQWNGQTVEAIAVYEKVLADRPEDTALRRKVAELNLDVQNYAAARDQLQKILKRDPENLPAHERLGEVYLELNQKSLAAAEFEQVLAQEPDNEVLRERVAEIYFADYNYERGLPHYERLFKRNPTRAGYLQRLVDVTESRYPLKTIAYYKIWLQHQPRDENVRTQLGWLYMDLGMTNEAASELESLAKAHPDNLNYLRELASLYMDDQALTPAAQTLDRILHLNEGDDEAANELYQHYLASQQYDRLLEMYDWLDTEQRLQLAQRREYAWLLLQSRDFRHARMQYEDILQQMPEDTESRMRLIMLLNADGEKPAALAAIDAGVQTYQSDDEGFLNFAARTLLDMNEVNKSIAIYEYLGDSSKRPQTYWITMLNLYEQQQAYGAAARMCERLIASRPDDTRWRFKCADLRWRLRQYERMHQLLADIDTQHGNEPRTTRDIGEFYFEHSMSKQAAPYLNRYLETAPTDSVSLRMVALAYAWNNQPSQARPAFDLYHSLYPNDYYTQYHLGLVLLEERDRKGAKEAFSHVLKILAEKPRGLDEDLVYGSILAHAGHRDDAIQTFEMLVAAHPDMPDLCTEYARALVVLREYDDALFQLDRVIAVEPQNLRALRLRGQVYLAQNEYQRALFAFKMLSAISPAEPSLQLDLAESELQTGDWVSASRRLKSVARAFPQNHHAQRRLLEVRRERSESFAISYENDKQSDTFLHNAATVFMTKAKSSLLSFKAWLRQDRYAEANDARPRQTHDSFGLGINRSGSKFDAGLTGSAHINDGQWRLGTQAELGWRFTPVNNVRLTADLNTPWRDPVQASFADGRAYRVQSDLNLNLLRNIVLWNRFSTAKYTVGQNENFGSSFLGIAQAGYTWPLRQPNLLTYYQFYLLNFDYENAAGADLIAIPERERVHFFGAEISQQLTGRLFYELGGSFGLNAGSGSNLYYGRLQLEYNLLRNLRLRSLLVLGTQSALTGRQNDRSLSLDLYYFY